MSAREALERGKRGGRFTFAILVNEDTSENYEDEDYDRSDDSAADGATR